VSDEILFNLKEEELENNIFPLLGTIGQKAELRGRWRKAQKPIGSGF